MILEIEDILENQTAVAHAALPDGVTLKQVFEHTEQLRQVKASIVAVRFNGIRVTAWEHLSPVKGDRVRITLAPRLPAIPAGVMAAIQVAVAVISVVTFFITLFNKPKSPKTKTDSPTYTYDGIRTNIVPGNPIPVIYGQHRTGGQLLSLSILVDVTGRQTHNMFLLLGLGRGDVTEVNCIRLNNIPIEHISSVSVVTRLGATSQSIIPGFEYDKNTFADGREIASGSPIVYTTQAVSLVSYEVILQALEGLVHYKDNGGRETEWVEYRLEHRLTGTTSYDTAIDRQRWTHATAAPAATTYLVRTSSIGQHDIRVTFLGTRHRDAILAGGQSKGRIWLTNVTEIEGAGEPYSGTALLALEAVATAEMHGQRPDVTALVRGKPVLVYSTTAVNTRTWTQNPAWCVLDYMTNSIYGMGAFIAPADVDIQSFINFATLCRSLAPDGRGSTEEQHHLDLVMDVQKPHWDWVQSILSNYRSSVIYSQQLYKVISDRKDLTLRQVFHSGNTIPGQMQLRVGGDPMRPNQVNVHFANQLLDYERDVRFVQNSSSILGTGDPIKEFDISLIGVARESEAIRNGSFELGRRRQVRREATFSTGLEALAVEPGDRCRVGVVTTDFEAGYGGRALDGSSSHVVLDREVDVKSGFTYDLFVWHNADDTAESVTVRSMTGVTITVTPTWVSSVLFNRQVMPGDRWGLGVNSEDLMDARVSRVMRRAGGLHEIVAEEYVTITPVSSAELSSALRGFGNRPFSDLAVVAPGLQGAPSQPLGVTATEEAMTLKDGSIVSKIFVDVSPANLVEGGRLTVPGTLASVTLGQSHNPNTGSLIGETLQFISGPSSGGAYGILAWGGSTTRVATVYPVFGTSAVPNSGDPYTLLKRQAPLDGFDLYVAADSGSDFAFWGAQAGYHAEFPVEAQQTDNRYVFRVVPYAQNGARNTDGTWTVSLTTQGDTVAPVQPGSISVVQGTGKSLDVFVYVTSEADLAGHEFYRNTVNSFGGATLIGRAREGWHDAGIDFETAYNYWARPFDRSFNVGSFIGPVTFAASRIITTDIASLNITDYSSYTNDSSIGFLTSPKTLASAVITTQAGIVMLNGTVWVQNVGPAQVQSDISLRVGSIGGTVLDASSPGLLPGLGGGIFLSFSPLHTPGTGTTRYYMVGACNSDNSIFVNNLRLHAIELKR